MARGKANVTSDAGADAAHAETFEHIQAISAALLDWYQAVKRDLPWRRRQDDPYAIWISEIMLQQTTVNAVVPFYERWMERFPTVHAVADASVDEVLRYWSGLGYYSRARNIKKAADIIALDYSGKFPSAWEDILPLPGIGPYTAGAIAAIAFNEARPALDVNANRVLARLAMLEPDLAPGSKVDGQASTLYRALLPSGRGRDFVQALMELGALVCAARDPRCDVCPLYVWCLAAQNHVQGRYPPPPPAPNWTVERHVAVAVVQDGKLLIVKRPSGSVWAGLWELPRVIAEEGESIDDAAIRAADEIVGIEITPSGMFGTVNHTVMHSKIALKGVLGRLATDEPAPYAATETSWVEPGELDRYAMSSPQKKLIKLWRDAMSGQPTLGI